ncbi:MAG: flagellar hook-associated protein FlgK [bacterium]|jgi:flagellar hook-associated protein 1 FlgK
MPNPFAGLTIGSTALQAFQYALDVTGQNITNVNTKGYSRQQVNLAASMPESVSNSNNFQLGTGVTIESIDRIRDVFIQERYRTASSENSRLESIDLSLQQVESVFSETETTGMSSQLNDFFNAFQDLANNPESGATRTAVRDAAKAVALTFRTMDSQLSQIDTSLSTQIQSKIDEVTSIASQIADLNEKISFATASGQTANDLMDKRDLLLQDLSKIVNVDVQNKSDGTVTIYAGNVQLVKGAASSSLPNGLDVTNLRLTDASGTVNLTGGTLAGLTQSLQFLRSYRTNLSTIATSLITNVNTLHQVGITANNTTNVLFFSGTGASNMYVSIPVLNDVNNIATGIQGTPGDGSQALSISRLREKKEVLLRNSTIGDFYGNQLSQIGQDKSYNASALETQQAVVQQLDNLQQSQSGVSLDEEMMNMMRYQRSYQAASHYISVCDQVIQTLIEQLGR